MTLPGLHMLQGAVDSQLHCCPHINARTVDVFAAVRAAAAAGLRGLGLMDAAGPERVVLASDSGSYVLPPPVEAFREFLIMIESAGFSEAAIRRMAGANPAWLFKLSGGDAS